MNAFQLYRFLVNAPVKEFQHFCRQYELHLTKQEATELQQLLKETPIYALRLPLSTKITDELKAIIGDSKRKQLLKLLKQYAI